MNTKIDYLIMYNMGLYWIDTDLIKYNVIDVIFDTGR